MMLRTYCLQVDKVLCNLPCLFSRINHTRYLYGSAVACLSNFFFKTLSVRWIRHRLESSASMNWDFMQYMAFEFC